MDPEVIKLLQQNLAISKENNELLRKVRSFQKRGRMFTIFYWILIIGVPLGAYYYLRPFISQATNLYTGDISGLGNVLETLNSFGDNKNIAEILKQLESGN